ncbi:Complement C3 [Triplophysa tibetana]|uniref:Complement C3 n=1 Tax=Triplophysa tibetana TaxID=1572043 RepID=A0A5A9PIQ2_9TELE|nr:Complement C3 [Triplophysa tibetana]
MDCDEPRSTASNDWALRQSLSEERWQEARPKLLDSLLSSDCVHLGPCDHCSLKEAVIRCKDCLPKPRYCGKCDVSTHQHLVFHNRETLIDRFYKPVPPSTAVQDLSGQNVIYEQVCLLPITRPEKVCDCDPQNLSVVAGRSVALICINGRYDMYLPVMNCRTCLASWTPEVGDLLCSGYWPGTVGFQTIYQLDVFTSFEDLKINAPGLSRQAFVKMLEQRSQQFGRVRGQPFFDGVFLASDKAVATFVDCVREKIKPTIQKTKEVKEDIEAIKESTQRSDEELQQWVTDVRHWAVDTPDDLRTDDPVALQHLIEGLFLGIQQKKRDLYRVTASGGLVAVASGGLVAVASGGLVAVASGGLVEVASGGLVAVASGGLLAVASGGLVGVASGGLVAAASGGVVAAASGGVVAEASGGLVAVASGGLVAVASGGLVAVASGGLLAVASGGLVGVASGGLVAVASGGLVAVASGGLVAVASGGLVAVVSGGLVAVASGGLVAVASGGLWGKTTPAGITDTWIIPGQHHHSLEATAYAVLALVKAKEYDTAGEAVHWMARQQSHYGGYDTTQATIMVFQAVAEYRTQVRKTLQKDFRLDVQLSVAKRSNLIRWTFTKDNLHATRSDKVLMLYYAKPGETNNNCKNFILSVKFQQEKSSYQMDTDATMTILEVGLLTGFDVDEGDLRELTKGKDRFIQDFEMNKVLSERGSLIIYLKKASHKEIERIAFRMHKITDAHLQPAGVTIYEYYSPEKCSLQKNEAIPEDDRWVKACESGMEYGTDEDVEGNERIFMNHPICRKSLDLKIDKTYLVMGKFIDMPRIKGRWQYILGEHTWIEYWPTGEESQTPEYSEKYIGISTLTYKLNSGCVT